jgi:hypothetical protein
MEGSGLESVSYRRAKLMVDCACAILGVEAGAKLSELQVPLSVTEFNRQLSARFGATHPDLVYRTNSTLERARLERKPGWNLPKVNLQAQR